MEAPYAQHSQPASSPASYIMPPGVPSSMSGDAAYRRDAPPQGLPTYHGPPPSQHPNHHQQYAYPSSALPNLPNRTPLPDQLLVPENGGAPAAGLPLPLGQVSPDAPEPLPHSMVEMGKRYTLAVVQQPKRARMCGFGDKDRRPITPPPCIRLIVTDAATGVEIDINDVEYGLYVLNVDLWSADGLREVNLVRHSTQTPGTSSNSPSAYSQISNPLFNALPAPVAPPNNLRDPQFQYHVNAPASQTASNNPSQPPYNPYPQQTQHYGQPIQQQNPSGHPPGHYPPHYQQQNAAYPPRPSSPTANYPSRLLDQSNPPLYYHMGTGVHGLTASSPRIVEPQPLTPTEPRILASPVPPATGMYTRNLIGSLSASAFRLTDPNDKSGVWFVLQDLSVRTEGHFRLRFSYVNVGAPSKTPNGNTSNPPSMVNRGSAPILASCYSDVFTVYSAKKFPGVVESTPLSKCFATQGIKIPIRKDGIGKASQRGEYDDDE